MDDKFVFIPLIFLVVWITLLTFLSAVLNIKLEKLLLSFSDFDTSTIK